MALSPDGLSTEVKLIVTVSVNPLVTFPQLLSLFLLTYVIANQQPIDDTATHILHWPNGAPNVLCSATTT